jgi:hypothetical protein
MDLRDLKVKTHGTFDLGEEKDETQLLNQLSRGKKRIFVKDISLDSGEVKIPTICCTLLLLQSFLGLKDHDQLDRDFCK